jgi:hypothetical protein
MYTLPAYYNICDPLLASIKFISISKQLKAVPFACAPFLGSMKANDDASKNHFYAYQTSSSHYDSYYQIPYY